MPGLLCRAGRGEVRYQSNGTCGGKMGTHSKFNLKLAQQRLLCEVYATRIRII